MSKKNHTPIEDDTCTEETWFDELLDRPENQHPQSDGTMLFGSGKHPDYPFFSREYWLDKKSDYRKAWDAIRPWNNPFRELARMELEYNNSNLYRRVFPFRWWGDRIRRLFSSNKSSRSNAMDDILNTTFFAVLIEGIIYPLLLGFVVAGILYAGKFILSLF